MSQVYFFSLMKYYWIGVDRPFAYVFMIALKHSKDIFQMDPMSVSSLSKVYYVLEDFAKIKKLETFLVDHWTKLKTEWEQPQFFQKDDRYKKLVDELENCISP